MRSILVLWTEPATVRKKLRNFNSFNQLYVSQWA